MEGINKWDVVSVSGSGEYVYVKPMGSSSSVVYQPESLKLETVNNYLIKKRENKVAVAPCLNAWLGIHISSKLYSLKDFELLQQEHPNQYLRWPYSLALLVIADVLENNRIEPVRIEKTNLSCDGDDIY